MDNANCPVRLGRTRNVPSGWPASKRSAFLRLHSFRSQVSSFWCGKSSTFISDCRCSKDTAEHSSAIKNCEILCCLIPRCFSHLCSNTICSYIINWPPLKVYNTSAKYYLGSVLSTNIFKKFCKFGWVPPPLWGTRPQPWENCKYTSAKPT